MFIKYRPSLSAIRHPQLHGLLHHRASNRPLHVRSLPLPPPPSRTTARLQTQISSASIICYVKPFAPIAGTIFALALLLSGASAGIVATIAG